MPNAFNTRPMTTAQKRRHPKPIKRQPLPGYVPKIRLPAGIASANAWALENAPPPTLPQTAFRDITDEMIGLPHDPVAQERAERFIRAAIAHRLHVEQKAAETATVVNVEVPDDALHLSHVTDRDIHRELIRLASRPARDRKRTGAAA